MLNEMLKSDPRGPSRGKQDKQIKPTDTVKRREFKTETEGEAYADVKTNNTKGSRKRTVLLRMWKMMTIMAMSFSTTTNES